MLIWEGGRDRTHRMKATDTTTPHDGYDPMRIFLQTVSRPLGKADEEIEFIVAGLNGSTVRLSIRRCGRTGCRVNRRTVANSTGNRAGN